MPLFARKGEAAAVTQHLSDIYTRDADKAAHERAEAEAQILAKERQLDDLSSPADLGEADALAECDRLEKEIAELHKVVRRKTRRERDLRASADIERKSEIWQRDQRQRRKQAKKSGERIAPAQRIEKHAALLMLAIRDLQNSCAALHTAWNEDWPFKGPAITYPERLLTLIGHELYARAKAEGVKWPTAEYSQTDWPGLSAKMREADKWVKRALLDGEATVADIMEPPIPPAQPQPVGAVADLLTPEPPAQQFTDEEIRANEEAGNPHGWPLSGGAWQATQDAATPAARDTNPWTGEEI